MDLSNALGVGNVKFGARRFQAAPSAGMKMQAQVVAEERGGGMDITSTKGLSPGTLIVLQRELETNPGFKPYLEEMLRDPDPAKRIFIEMQKSKMNVLNPKAFDKDVNTKKWQWSRRRIKPIIMNAESKGGRRQDIRQTQSPSGFPSIVAGEATKLGDYSGMGDLGIFSMIASALVEQGSKELSKPENQKSIMNFAGKKTSNRDELRARRNQVADMARKQGIPETQITKDKTEAVADGSKTFEQAFGLASKLNPGVIKKIATDEIGYQNAQAAKLSEESAEALGVRQERRAGITSSNTTMLIGGGVAAAVLAILAMRRK